MFSTDFLPCAAATKFFPLRVRGFDTTFRVGSTSFTRGQAPAYERKGNSGRHLGTALGDHNLITSARKRMLPFTTQIFEQPCAQSIPFRYQNDAMTLHQNYGTIFHSALLFQANHGHTYKRTSWNLKP